MPDSGDAPRIEVELFTDGGNNAVVRMPERKFPGVVVQGDTLATLWDSAARALEDLRAPHGRQAGLDELASLVMHLDSMLVRYQRALDAHGLRRPYSVPNR